MLQTKPSTNHLSHLYRDRGYRYNDRDPLLTEICTLITKSGLSTQEIAQKARDASGGGCSLHSQTLDKWLNGSTRKPQNFTVTWTLFALGYERRLVKIREAKS